MRDNIHSHDLVRMFEAFIENPRCGEVYNAGGSRFSNCSVLEAIELCEQITGNRMKITYSDKHRAGDHIWYISSVEKFKSHYPGWSHTYTVADILCEIFAANKARWSGHEELCYQLN